MTTQANSRSAAEVLIDALKINAVERIFCIPGESFLAALDALYDRSEISLVVCRNEGGAAYMAEADGKLTGRPGVCFVTRDQVPPMPAVACMSPCRIQPR